MDQMIGPCNHTIKYRETNLREYMTSIKIYVILERLLMMLTTPLVYVRLALHTKIPFLQPTDSR